MTQTCRPWTLQCIPLIVALVIGSATGCDGGQEDRLLSGSLKQSYVRLVESQRKQIQIEAIPFAQGRTVSSVSESAAISGLGRLLSVSSGGYIDRGPLDQEYLLISSIQPLDTELRPAGRPIQLANVTSPLLEHVGEFTRAVRQYQPLVYYLGESLTISGGGRLVNVDRSRGEVFYAVEPFPMVIDVLGLGTASPLTGTDEIPPSTPENLAPLQRVGLNVKRFVAPSSRR